MKQQPSKAKQIFRIVLLLGTAGSLFIVPWPIVHAWILPLPDSVQGQLEQTISHGFDGVIVYVDRGKQPPSGYAAGWHDRYRQIPADPDALFKIASISKLYDAAAITRLIHQEKLSLDVSMFTSDSSFMGTKPCGSLAKLDDEEWVASSLFVNNCG